MMVSNVSNIPGVVPSVKAGKVRANAISNAKPFALVPTIPVIELKKQTCPSEKEAYDE